MVFRQPGSRVGLALPENRMRLVPAIPRTLALLLSLALGPLPLPARDYNPHNSTTGKFMYGGPDLVDDMKIAGLDDQPGAPGADAFRMGLAFMYGLEHRRVDYGKALSWFRMAAAQRNQAAKYFLGRLLLSGDGGEKDPAQAWRLFNDAADHHVPAAEAMVSWMLATGTGTEKNPSLAYQRAVKAAERGDAGAQVLAGQLCEEGLGTPRDAARAREWYRKAAKLDHPAGMFKLGESYFSGGEGAGKDYAEAAVWLRKAAVHYPLAEYYLGVMQEEGLGMSPDAAGAAGHFRGAAAGNVLPARLRLGLLYVEGRGVARDPAAAAREWQSAASGGIPEAQHNLAMLYYKGEGLEQSPAKAAAWFRQAARTGYVPSQFTLGLLYDEGAGVTRNEAQAYEWLSLAAAQDHPGAKTALAELQARLTPGELQEGQALRQGWLREHATAPAAANP